MADSPKQRSVQTSKVVACISEMARREAEREARRIPWQRLLHAGQQYIELNAYSLWVGAISDAEGCIPPWLAKTLDERCPGMFGTDRATESANQAPPLYRRIMEWTENSVLAQAKNEGWLRAVTFHAARDPDFVRDCAYWQDCVRQWKRERPPVYPSFEQWRKASEQCADEVLDTFDMTEEKRRIIKVRRTVGPQRLAASVAEYMEWEAFTYWARSLLESDTNLPGAVANELQRRCPGFLECDRTLRSTLSPEDYTKRWKALLEWGENRFFSEPWKEGWFDLTVFEARAHPRSVRTVDYWVFCWDEYWSNNPHGAYPTFEEWRRAADDFVFCQAATAS